ncbi:MAG: hypothetical protein K0R69_1693 [Clostridia bacterium]|jgi:hypothetical protein|nr:hypothetical protein [Clostridia bacterium]
MSYSLLIPLEVFGLGFVISLGMALLIKVMLFTIRKFSNEAAKDPSETH